MGREDEIKLIAYSIWEQEDYCNGRDVEHWLMAEIIWDDQQKRPAPKNITMPKKSSVRRKKTKTTSKKS